MKPMEGDTPPPKDDALSRILSAAAVANESIEHSDFFYRQLVVEVARTSTHNFQESHGLRSQDGADAVRSYVRHETSAGRLQPDEVQVRGLAFQVEARVHACPFVSACRENRMRAGDVTHCFRAVTLIEAMNAVPRRPLMTYDLAPGLVDETDDHCRIQLRPAGEPPSEPSTPVELA